MNDYLSEVFGDGGLFASRFPGYELREGQVALARMVDEAMRGGRHALGEGPCGTGKSVGYAVPAVWHAHHEKKRVVIATANIALQEQLVRKDLPMLASVLPWPFTFALLKGRNNYVCLDRLAESEARGELRGLFDDGQQRQLDDVLAWAEATKTGDVSELPFIPAPQVWSRFAVGSDECKGDGCPFREECFSERAKAVARGADIIVTNYHILLTLMRPGAPLVQFVIDAKYRLDVSDDYISVFGCAGPPVDAVNALHRYRDAIALGPSHAPHSPNIV